MTNSLMSLPYYRKLCLKPFSLPFTIQWTILRVCHFVVVAGKMGASYFLKCVSFPCFPCLLLRAPFWKERKQRGSEPILYYLYYNKKAGPDNSRLYSEQVSFQQSKAGGDIKEFTIVLHSLFKNLTVVCSKWNVVAHWSEFTYYLQVSKSYLTNL